MSADNWAVCPRYLHEAEAARDVALNKAREAYGVVPPEEFDDLRAEANRPIDEDALTTFREDYEFYGVGKGTITVSYSGRHSCHDASKPIAGNRRFEGEGDAQRPVCAECLEGIDSYGE